MEKPLNELHLNLAGKILLASIGAWLIGRATNVKIRGTEDQVNAVMQAMVASRAFQDELSKPGATIDSVMSKLNVKNMTVAEFEKLFHLKWPL